MQKDYQHFKNRALQFLEELFQLIERQGILIEKHWNIDHLCFRVSTDDEYLKFKKQFSIFSTLLIESEVNGRLISTFKFIEPIQFKDWSIGLVELPAPKKGKSTALGFEHIEIVVDVPLKSIQEKYSSCTFDEGGLRKLFNQELEISFGKLAIKFHLLSLESVINVEKNQKLFAALYSSGVLQDFKIFDPLVTGTFPLDIAVINSDVDIIMSSDNLEELGGKLRQCYSDRPGFKMELNKDFIVAEFSHAGFTFEFFAEKTASALQKANLHFLIEERLLKIGSENFRNEILQLKQTGLKTEPAFAKLLNLSGDPYQALLDIRKKSEAELLTLLP